MKFYVKYWTHHKRKYVYDVSNFLLFNFVRFDFQKAPIKPCESQKALCFKQLFACLFDSNGNRNGHTNHGVVT